MYSTPVKCALSVVKMISCELRTFYKAKRFRGSKPLQMRPHVRLWQVDTGNAEALTNVAKSGWTEACRGQVRPGRPPPAVPALQSH